METKKNVRVTIIIENFVKTKDPETRLFDNLCSVQYDYTECIELMHECCPQHLCKRTANTIR